MATANRTCRPCSSRLRSLLVCRGPPSGLKRERLSTGNHQQAVLSCYFDSVYNPLHLIVSALLVLLKLSQQCSPSPVRGLDLLLIIALAEYLIGIS